MTAEETTALFKRCSYCAASWPTRDAFLDDPKVELLGYQSFIEDGVPGLFMFNHACGTTLAIRLEAFRDMHDGPAGAIGRIEPDQPNDYCLTSSAGECPGTCECALVRDVISQITDE